MKVKLLYKQGDDEAGSTIDVPAWKAKVMVDSLLGEYADKNEQKTIEKRDKEFRELVERSEHLTVEEMEAAPAEATNDNGPQIHFSRSDSKETG